MSVPTDRDVYISRCLRVAAEAQAAGLTMLKCGPLPTLKISRNGREVTFPIVTDTRTWRETTVEEAFYVVLVDAYGWTSASDSLGNDGVITSLDESEKNGLPVMRKDLGLELERIKSLADMLGGNDKLHALYATAEIG
jgi:hypothetical protein